MSKEKTLIVFYNVFLAHPFKLTHRLYNFGKIANHSDIIVFANFDHHIPSEG